MDNTETHRPSVEHVSLTVPFPETFIYSNASSYSLTMMDLKIGFGVAMPDRTVKPCAGVVMPLEHAAHIAITLIAQLHAFEDNFGAIRHPVWAAVSDEIRAIFNGIEGMPTPRFEEREQPGETPRERPEGDQPE